MKTAESSTYRTILQYLNQNTARMQAAQVAVASGKKVSKASDDPAGLPALLSAKTQLKGADTYIKTGSVALDRLKAQDTQLGQADSLLARAIEITTASANGSYGANERLGMADEIRDIKAEMLGVANSQLGGRYFYGGYTDRSVPFSTNPAYDPILDPRPVLYNGDNGVAQLETGPSEQMGVSFPGSAVFMGDENGDGTVDAGQVDIFATLTSLENALRANDQAGATAQLGNLGLAQAQIGLYRSRTATAANRLDLSQSKLADQQVDLKAVISRYEDVDVLEAITQMTQQEQALQAAMDVTGRISKLSILNYL